MIRPATLEDLDKIMSLARLMHAEAPAYSGWTWDDAKARAFLAAMIENPNACVYVVEQGGWLVGGVAGFCIEQWFSREKFASDVALFVDPAFRNGIVAMRLINVFTEWAEMSGAKRVSLGVTTGVHPEKTGLFYERIGLAKAGVTYSKDFSHV